MCMYVQLQAALTQSQQPAAGPHTPGAALITHINEQPPSTRKSKAASSSPCYHDSLLTCVVRLET